MVVTAMAWHGIISQTPRIIISGNVMVILLFAAAIPQIETSDREMPVPPVSHSHRRREL
jgi:hypothetical protein